MSTNNSSNNRNSDSASAWKLVGLIVGLAIALVGGGFFMMDQKKVASAERRAQASAYANYRSATEIGANTRQSARQQSTRPNSSRQSAAQSAAESAAAQARLIRSTLLMHPAVTPGDGFDSPGVQATGFAIVQALDKAGKN